MNNFKSYIQALAQEPYVKKPVPNSTAILLPELDTTEGIYRTLIPSYMINALDDCRIIIMGISQKTSISINEKNFQIPAKLINECNHIVFPFVSFSLQEVIDDIKSRKPSMKFSYYIDCNFYQMPDSYPHSSEYAKSKNNFSVIENNIKAVDQVIVTNKALKDYIGDKLKEKYPNIKFNTNIRCQPLFFLPELTKVEYQNDTDKEKLSILMVGDDYQFSDFNWIRGILKDIQEKYKDKVNIHIIGFDGKRGDKNYLKDITFEHHPRQPYFNYFQLIKHIAPNIMLIPANDSVFNKTSKNYIKYLELAYLNIPVIAPNIPAYADLISTNKNGFLCSAKEDYAMQLDTFFTAPDKFESVTGPAYATATDYDIKLENNIEILKQIYFPK